jgi:probable phosphoglycerate mutase
MRATRLIVIRHGETAWNRERRMQGHSDTPLSAIGRAQAEALGRRLAGGRYAALYTSDLSRARDTAAAIAAHTGYEIVAEPRLRERRFGLFEGLTAEEIRERFPQEYVRFASRDPDYAIPGGESARAFTHRALGCLGEIAARHAGLQVLVVTHGLVLDALYRAAEGLAPEAIRPVPLLNASLNTFAYEAGAWRLEFWGDVGHLAQQAPAAPRGAAA